MLICLVLCISAVLPTAFIQPVLAESMRQPMGKDNDFAHRYAYAIARQLGMPGFPTTSHNEEDEKSSTLHPDNVLLKNVDQGRWKRGLPWQASSTLDSLGGGHLLRRDILDSIGGGHLLRRDLRLDPIGGGHLLKRGLEGRQLDSIGGGNLLKRIFDERHLDSIGGGHLLKRAFEERHLDPIGGGNLLKRDMRLGQFYPPNDDLNLLKPDFKLAHLYSSQGIPLGIIIDETL